MAKHASSPPSKETKAQVEKVAKQVDDQAAKLSTNEGTVGDVAGKAHEVIDKVDGD